ncbi:MAG: hypothetical protein HY094_01395 [Candidatus Melainabacteria bacterium]|nr:hypothetical protein [Candidatus Melainabacteria bacterium]
MSKIKIISIFLFVSVISFNFLSPSVFSQTQNPAGKVDTFTISLNGSTLSSASGLNITIGLPSGAQLDTGLTFMANGASQLLTDVNVSTGLLTVVWSGAVSDSKVTITGMLKPNSQVDNASIMIIKVEASGGRDITGSVVANVTTLNSLATPTPTPTPEMPTPTPTATPLSDAGLTIITPDSLSLKPRGLNVFKINIVGLNFKSISKCQATSSDDSLIKIKPKIFVLSPARNKKSVLVRLSRSLVSDIIDNGSSEDITVSVSCVNGAGDEKNVTLIPPIGD